MATKPDNRMTFYSRTHGYVQLVRRSVARYKWERPDGSTLDYWHGQLVHNWDGHIIETDESWNLNKGQVIWLDAAIFHCIPAADYLDYTNT